MLGTGRKTQYFNTAAEGQIAKKQLYTDMFIDKALYNDLNDPSGNSNEIVDLFNSSNINVEIVEDTEGNVLYMVGDNEKGTAKYYNANNNSDMMNFKTFIKQNTKGVFNNLGNLNEDPKTWGLERNVYETANDPAETEQTSGGAQNAASSASNSILNSPVSENNNMEQTSGQGASSAFNFQGTQVNQGFNFNN